MRLPKILRKPVYIAELYCIHWLLLVCPLLAPKFGIVGIMAAKVEEGPDKGMPLGIALALTKVKEEK